VVFDVFIVLFESKLTVREARSLIQQVLDAAGGSGSENRAVEQLIVSFRSLFRDKTELMKWYATEPGWRRHEEAEQSVLIAFQPRINEHSRALD